jgi:aspartate/methionine/tyrosine aminotransferase
LLFAAILEPGSEVLLPDPGWPNYHMMATMVGARSTFYPCRIEDGFIPQVADVRAAVTNRTKIIVLNSPNNPTGAVYPAEVVQQFIDLAEEHNLLLVSDEAYDEVYYGDAPVSAMNRVPLESERCVGVYTFSKTYSMTGWRLGYTVASRQISGMLTKLQEPTVSCVSAISQRAGLAALQGPQDFVAEQRKKLMARRDLVLDKLRAAGRFSYVPQGAFYVLIDVRPRPSRSFALSLLESRAVSVAPGIAFGAQGDGFIRVSYASGGDRLAEAMEHIVQALG